MKKYLGIGIFFFGSALARGADYHRQIDAALNYLAATQISERGDYEPGEWATEVQSILLPSALGAGFFGKKYPEATNFTTASIMTILGSMYVDDPALDEIPSMMAKAADGFSAYLQDPLYNFYPPKKRKGKSVWIRGPRRMYLNALLRGLANVPSDADSTSVAYTALNYAELVKQKNPSSEFVISVSEKVYDSFLRFRDLHRKPHYYDRAYGYRNTGAFMTWLMDEKDPNMPHGVAPPEAGRRIPFGTNDVDCVVNTNVLKLFTWAEKTQPKGYQQSCEYIKNVIQKMHYGVCGIYYPNRYFLPLGVAELKSLGADCLEDHYAKVLWYVSGTQDLDGGWTNDVQMRKDRVQSTLLALNTLMLLGDPKNPIHRQQVHKAVKFILSRAEYNSRGQLFWPGEVFFSAVSQARYSVVWRSNAYTTALAARALLWAEKF